jgi:hypothetical protein
MTSIAKKIVFLLFAFIATAAQGSSFYIGLDAAKAYGATWKTGATEEKISAGIQAKPVLGFMINERYGIEVAALSVKVSKGNTSESIMALPVNLVYTTPLSAKTSFLLKGGLAPFRAKFSNPSYDVTETILGLSFGIGINYQFSRSVGLTSGIDYLSGYRYELPNGNRYDLSPANAYLGLRFGF